MRIETANDLLAWESMMKDARAFFDTRGFHEVTTPHLVPQGAFESAIDTIQIANLSGVELHTSPEIEMKHLMAKVKLPIFQICRCFRDDPATGIHWKEFTMLEFYRLNADYEKIQQDMVELIETLAKRKLNWLKLTAFDAVRQFADVDLNDAETVSRLSKDESFSDAFFRLMVDKVEPALPPERPVLITDYPIAVSPLSKKKGDSILAERFEIYWHGMELCNGCTELDDPEELRRRYKKESETRRAAGKAPHAFPTTLYESMKSLPPSAGVAVGMERLFLCLQKIN